MPRPEFPGGKNKEGKMQFHKVADIFPLLEGEEFDALTQDIRENGLLEPIWVHDDQIIDGRNRFRACEEAGVKPDFQAYRGTEEGLISFVVSLNLIRRHLSVGQRSALSVQLLPMLRKEAKVRMLAGVKIDPTQKSAGGEARDVAASLVGVSHASVDEAEVVSRRNPEVFERLKAGEVNLPQATAVLDLEDKAANALLDRAVREHWSGREVENRAKFLMDRDRTQTRRVRPEREAWSGWRKAKDVLDVIDWAKHYRQIWDARLGAEFENKGDLGVWIIEMRTQVKALDETLKAVGEACQQ